MTPAVALRHGLGKHTKAIPSTDVKPYLLVNTCEETAYRLPQHPVLTHPVLTLYQYTFLSELYYATDITLIKCSILCFYLRIFGVNRRFRLMCYGMIAFVVVWGSPSSSPPSSSISPCRAGGTFPDQENNASTSSTLLLAPTCPTSSPMPRSLRFLSLWSGNCSFRVRARSGSSASSYSQRCKYPRPCDGWNKMLTRRNSATIISILRVTFNAHIDVTDPTWNFVKVALSTVEVSVGVCCACMPVIYLFLRVLVGRKIRPSTPDSTALKTGHSRESLRPRHKFSQLDEGLNMSHLYDGKLESSSSNVNGHRRADNDDIPMGRIKVTCNLDVEHTGGA